MSGHSKWSTIKHKKAKEDAFVHESTVDDNIFADPEYVKILDSLINEDQNYYNIYRLGLWGVLRGLIYTKFQIILDKQWPESVDETIYGLDFGYNNPSALVEINIKDSEFYLKEMLYESKLTNNDLIKKLERFIPNKRNMLYADSAEPARIDEIKRAGFNVYPSNKSVMDGIDFCKRKTLHIHEDSTNIDKELRAYKWKEDKNGNTLDEPVKFNDHSLDAIRYAIFTHCGKPKRVKEFGGSSEARN